MTANAAALEFAGILTVYGGGRNSYGPRIDGRDVIEEIQDRFPGPTPVRVYLGVEPVAEGRIWATHGFGGTDVTPADAPEIVVGDRDILARLDDLDGREVLLIVEPLQSTATA